MKSRVPDFMTELDLSVRPEVPAKPRILIYMIFVMVVTFVIWAREAQLDEITRGIGKIVSSSKNQIVQHLEGGIVTEILVRQGDSVEAGQALLRIENMMSASNLSETRIRLKEMIARQMRLVGEASDGIFPEMPKGAELPENLIESERSLFKSNIEYLENQYKIIDEQILQRRSELKESEIRVNHGLKNLELVQKQLDVSKPLMEKGVESQTDYLRLERDRLSVKDQIETAKAAQPRILAAISELEKKKNDIRMSFQTRAQKELNELTAQISQMQERKAALSDQAHRTLVVSPIKGSVKQMYVNTINGVVRPGMDLLEIVPSDDSLLIETKVQPSDIAFLHPGQMAKAKVTAYDFSIYGSLDGRVVDISADSLMEPNGIPYFLVRIKTDKTYLGSEEKPLRIMPGMQVSVDILTGKKTVMDYLLKPIFKAKNQALTER